MASAIALLALASLGALMPAPASMIPPAAIAPVDSQPVEYWATVLQLASPYAGSPAHDTTFVYDDAERLAERDEPLGRITAYAYDGVGNVTTETLSDTGSGGVSGFAPRVTTTGYDALNRRIRIDRTADAGVVTTLLTLDGNGNVVLQQDPLGRLTAMRYDELNRQLQSDGPEWQPGSPTETVLAYDGNGNLVSQTWRNAPHDRVHTAVFDALNRPTQRTDSLGHTTSYEYDAAGNLTRQIDPLLDVANFAYDARNRLTQQAVQLTRVTVPARQVVTAYGYDRVGNRTSEQLPNGNAVAHVYDALNRLTATSDSVGPVLACTYDANGQRLTETDANGTATSPPTTTTRCTG